MQQITAEYQALSEKLSVIAGEFSAIFTPVCNAAAAMERQAPAIEKECQAFIAARANTLSREAIVGKIDAVLDLYQTVSDNEIEAVQKKYGDLAGEAILLLNELNVKKLELNELESKVRGIHQTCASCDPARSLEDVRRKINSYHSFLSQLKKLPAQENLNEATVEARKRA